MATTVQRCRPELGAMRHAERAHPARLCKVLTDDEAHEFLKRVYDDNAFDVAIHYDEDYLIFNLGRSVSAG